MRLKLSLFTLVLILTLSACGTAPQPRTLQVTGSGTVSLVPDIAYIYIGVHTSDSDIASAVNANNTRTQALVDALKNAGIATEDIQTSNFSVYNNAGYDKNTGLPTDNTYAVDNTVYITVRDLTKLGSLLKTTIGAGANTINNISFDVADKSAALVEARQKAMDNAASLAKELAKDGGLALGTVQNVSYTDYSSGYYGYGVGGGGASAPNASVPIQPGMTQITATVNITYTLK